MKLVIHAPTPEAVARARSNAKNFKAARPEAEVRIVVNAGGVGFALDNPDPATDGWLLVCGNTLTRQGRTAPDRLTVVEAAIVTLAERQADGWAYVRA